MKNKDKNSEPMAPETLLLSIFTLLACLHCV